MGLSINQNIAAVNSYRNLNNTQNDLSKSLQSLSSGLRINSAKDDAAGLSISEGLKSQAGGMKVAMRNAQDGISLAQTAEGALTETGDLLQRMRDLAVQSANATISTDDKKAMQAEVAQLTKALDRIASDTSFNGKKLLDGSLSNTQFQVGANAEEKIDVSIGNMSSSALGVANLDLTKDAAAAVDTIDEAIKNVSTERSNFGAVQNRLEHTINNLGASRENLFAANSRIQGADFASETSNLTKTQLLLQSSSTSMLSQANQLSQSVLSLLR
jgi:flagellin